MSSPYGQRPVLHGRDHMEDGPDPIPGMGGGGGIQFETYPQAGEWLYIETTGAGTSPSGYGMEIFDDSGNGIGLNSGGCRVELNAFGSDTLLLDGDAGITVQGGSGNITSTNGGNWSSASTGTATLTSSDTVTLKRQGGSFGPTELVITDGVLDFKLNGTPILRVDGTDGTYHISTGASWAADL